LTWDFPVRGVSEAPPSKDNFHFKCKARDSVMEILELSLFGLAPLAKEEKFR